MSSFDRTDPFDPDRFPPCPRAGCLGRYDPASGGCSQCNDNDGEESGGDGPTRYLPRSGGAENRP